MTPKEQQQLRSLIIKMLDGAIATEEAAHLNQHLKNPHALTYYLDFIEVSQAIRKLNWQTNLPQPTSIGSQQDAIMRELVEYEVNAKPLKKEPEKPATPVTTAINLHRPSRRDTLLALVRVAAVALIAVALIWLDNNGWRFNLRRAPVATIAHAAGAAWSPGSLNSINGSNLYPGRFELREGYVGLTLRNGVETILQAPIAFTLKWPDNLRLTQGSLTCKVPDRAKGFTVTTPQATVVDFGTQFGVQVTKDNQTEAQVRVGHVQMIRQQGPTIARITLDLKAGDAALTSDRGLETIPFLETAFYYHMPFPYEESVRHLTPSLYLRAGTDQTALLTQLIGGMMKIDATGTILRGIGPLLGNDRTGPALIFDGQTSYLAVTDIQGVAHSDNKGYALSFWFCPASSQPQHLLSSRVTDYDKTEYYRCIAIDPEGYVALKLYHTDNATPFDTMTNRKVKVIPDTWYHVVLTNAQNGNRRLYVNGVVHAQSNGGPVTGWMDGLYLGALPHPVSTDDNCQFKGRIGEIALFNHDLTTQEVKKLYQSCE